MSHGVSNNNSGNARVVVQTGDVTGGIEVNVVVGAAAPQAFSSMLDSRPAHLLGRAAELRRLREFCAGPDPYLWVRAESWSGKSALLKTFASEEHDGLWLVWFFVKRGHSDKRADFVRVVSHQLAALLGENAPTGTGLVGEDEFSRLLTEAAARCPGRLVLLVDGLDEEQGEGSESIVGLLPARPPAGLRVIVSSRPQRPLVQRVTEDARHPLRSPEVVWQLPRSEHATVVEMAAHEDLRALTRGTEVEKGLLGYVTAADGGLTVRDLADLLRVFHDEVEAVLEGLTGRSFARVQSLWRPEHVRYFLDHPSLQEDAAGKIGRRRLAEFTEGLRTWAHEWRDLGWPADTPEYLLLTHPADDPVPLALDPARHVRLRALTGSNAAALAEIATAREALADGSDLAALAQLAVLHDDLSRRTAVIPPQLPAVWAGLGHLARAESLIGALPADGDRVRACAEVLARVREPAVVSRFRALAETALDRIDQPEALGAARADLAQALIAVGDLDAAQALADRVRPELVTGLHDDLVRATWEAGDEERATALCDLASSSVKRRARLVTTAALELTARGRYGEAADFVTARVRDELRCSKALAAVVCAAADRDPDQALEVLHRIKTTARYHKVKGDVAIALALHRHGRTTEARARLELAESRISGVSATAMDATLYDGAVGELVRAWVALGEPERAVELGRSLRTPDTRGRHLVPLVGHLLRAGHVGHAKALARTAATELAVVAPAARRAEGYLELIKTIATTGDTGLTSGIAAKARAAATATHPDNHATALAAIDLAVATGATPDRRAELIAALPDQSHRAAALTDLAVELAEADDLPGALRVVAAVPDPATQAEVLTALTTTVPAQARRLAESAESAGAADEARSRVRAAVARALLQIGAHAEALATAREITEPHRQATILTALVAAAEPGAAEPIAREITHPYYRVRAFAHVLRTTDDPRRARDLLADARSALGAVDANWRLSAHTELIVATAAALGVPACADLVAAAHGIAAGARPSQAPAVHELAIAVADLGLRHPAARIARCIHDVPLRCRVLSEVAVSTARHGEPELAAEFAEAVRTMATAIGDVAERSRALAAADEAQAAALSAEPVGHNDDGTTAPEVTGTQDVPAPPSRRELAALLTAPNWTEVLHVLAAAEPEAVRALAQALPQLYR